MNFPVIIIIIVTISIGFAIGTIITLLMVNQDIKDLNAELESWREQYYKQLDLFKNKYTDD